MLKRLFSLFLLIIILLFQIPSQANAADADWVNSRDPQFCNPWKGADESRLDAIKSFPVHLYIWFSASNDYEICTRNVVFQGTSDKVNISQLGKHKEPGGFEQTKSRDVENATIFISMIILFVGYVIYEAKKEKKKQENEILGESTLLKMSSVAEPNPIDPAPTSWFHTQTDEDQNLLLLLVRDYVKHRKISGGYSAIVELNSKNPLDWDFEDHTRFNEFNKAEEVALKALVDLDPEGGDELAFKRLLEISYFPDIRND